MTHFADRWTDPGDDPCAGFFAGCLKLARFDIPFGGRALEIGCAEYDWRKHLKEQCPDIEWTGIDWRIGHEGIQADVLTYEFPSASFDAVISISTIEHIGLGHYDHDPLDPDGDSNAIARAWRWLKPGGTLFFDVPFSTEGYTVQGTSHREYDRDAIIERLWIKPLVDAKGKARWEWEGYAPASQTHLVQTEVPKHRVSPFWYAGFYWRKVG